MKVLQLLLDGYNKSNEVNDLYDKSLFKNYECESFDTKIRGTGRLSSPRMWGRTLYGPKFVCNSSFDPHKSDKWNAENQGYLDSLDQSLWIWNQLPDKVGVFAIPYYLIYQIENPDIVITDNTTIDTYDYKKPSFKRTTNTTNEVVPTKVKYHEICDTFDNPETQDQEWRNKIVPESHKCWESPERLSKFISTIHERTHKSIYKMLNENWKFITDEYFKYTYKYSDFDDQYFFIGATDSDALYHYMVPYLDVFNVLKINIDSLLMNVVDKFDVIIIHGDHNMDRTNKIFRKDKYKHQFTYNGITSTCHVPYYNRFPMYCDHGFVVGGEIYYKPEVKSRMTALFDRDPSNKSKIFTDYVREWLINEAYR